MGLNKPITVGGGLTAAEVQSIVDAQTTAISEKVDAQTNTLKTDIPSSISGGASISDINAALDEKLPQYQNGAVVKSKQFGTFTPSNDVQTIAISPIDPSKSIVIINGGKAYTDGGYSSSGGNVMLTELSENSFTCKQGSGYDACYQIVEFY